MKASELSELSTAKLVELIQRAESRYTRFILSPPRYDEYGELVIDECGVLQLAQELARRAEAMIPVPQVQIMWVTRAERLMCALYVRGEEIDVYETYAEAVVIKERLESALTPNTKEAQ